MFNPWNLYWAVMNPLMELTHLTYGELCVLIWGLICPLSVILPETYLAYKTKKGRLKTFRCAFLLFMCVVYAAIILFLLNLPMIWNKSNMWDNMNQWLIQLSASWTGGFNAYYGLLWFSTGVFFPLFCWIYYVVAIIKVRKVN